MHDKNDDGHGRPSASLVVGAVAIVFLIVGYQVALFVRHAAVTKIVADHDAPDTVFVYQEGPWQGSGNDVDKDEAYLPGISETASTRRYVAQSRNENGKARVGNSGKERGPVVVRRNAEHGEMATEIRRDNTPRRYENFRFDPNTASVDEFMRLGFSEKQAQSIDNYRKKGGHFRRKSDFAKSYVVQDSVYQRLEPYIDIPKLDLNVADSAAFETLPGIGGFFASKMVEHRGKLGSYSYPEQLMDIWRFDEGKFAALADLIYVNPSNIKPYELWTLSEKELAEHPYIGRRAAHGIVVFRDNSPIGQWSVESLAKAGVLDKESAAKLGKCVIAPPEMAGKD